MRYLKTGIVMTLAALLVLTLRLHGQAPQRESLVWAPVPTTPNGWVAPNKPHTKLADVIAAHKGQASWREPIVRDVLLGGDYVQMAPARRRRASSSRTTRSGGSCRAVKSGSRSKGRSRLSPPRASSSRSPIETSINWRRLERRRRCSSR